MGGKQNRLIKIEKPTDGASGGRNPLMDQQAMEAFSADMRRIARTQGVCRTKTSMGTMVMIAKEQSVKYNWRYRVTIEDPNTKQDLFLIRESNHPTMVDISVSLVLRLCEWLYAPQAEDALEAHGMALPTTEETPSAAS